MRDFRERSFTLHAGASYAVRKERQAVISFFTVNSPLSYGPMVLGLSLTEIKWTMPEHASDLLSCWIGGGGSKSKKKWWRLIPSCIWWTIWWERNGRCFENKVNSIQKVKGNCIAAFTKNNLIKNLMQN